MPFQRISREMVAWSAYGLTACADLVCLVAVTKYCDFVTGQPSDPTLVTLDAMILALLLVFLVALRFRSSRPISVKTAVICGIVAGLPAAGCMIAGTILFLIGR